MPFGIFLRRSNVNNGDGFFRGFGFSCRAQSFGCFGGIEVLYRSICCGSGGGVGRGGRGVLGWKPSNGERQEQAGEEEDFHGV